MVKLPALLQGLLRRAHAGAQSQAGSRAGPRSPHRKTMIFESLEPRLLLSDTTALTVWLSLRLLLLLLLALCRVGPGGCSRSRRERV